MQPFHYNISTLIQLNIFVDSGDNANTMYAMLAMRTITASIVGLSINKPMINITSLYTAYCTAIDIKSANAFSRTNVVLFMVECFIEV